IVNVSWVNVAPTADAGSNQSVNEGVAVTLDGTDSTDPDDSIASYLWTQTIGTTVTISNPSSATPEFTAPYIGTDSEALTFQLAVTDTGGLSGTDTVIINVSDVNLAPVADAGDDQSVDMGDGTVTLSGLDSYDSDGTIETYSWTQTSGATVTLSNSAAAQPTFTAPVEVGQAGESLTFQLTVTDDGGLQATDNCTIDILWVDFPPAAPKGFGVKQ
ncbi:MAG: peptidase M36, partial [Planctomycetes bacterium]|nr:peptidase M36 [Planctomycetota bacterium]